MADIVQLVISASDRTGPVWAKLQAKFSSLSTQITTLGTLTAGILASGLAAAVKHSIDLADEMDKMAARTGIATDEISKLAYAANLANVSNESLELGLKALSHNLAEAAGDAGSKAAVAFRAMGLDMSEMANQAKPLKEIFIELADKFRSYADSVNKSSLAQEVFGKGARGLLPLLNDGGAAIEAAGRQAETFGLVVTKALGKNADEFNDNLRMLGEVVTGLGLRVAANLLPQLIKLSQAILGNVENSDALAKSAAQLSTFLRLVGTGALAAWTGMRAVAEVVRGSLLIDLDLLNITVYQTGRLFVGLGKIAIELTAALLENVRVLGGLGTVLVRILERDFKGAFDQAHSVVVQFTAGMKADVFDALLQVGILGADTSKSVKKAWESLKTNAENTLLNIANQSVSARAIFDAIWSAPVVPGANAKKTGGGTAAPNVFGAAGVGKGTDIDQTLSREFDKFAELQRDFTEAGLEGSALVMQQIENDYARRFELALKNSQDMEQFNQLMLLNDKAYFKARQQLNQQAVAGAAQMFGNIAQFALAFGKKGFAAFKAFASAEALINTFAAAQAAYKAMAGIPVVGPALAVAAAAAAVVAGLARVAQINSTEASGSAHAGLDSVPTDRSIIVQGGERIVQKEANEDLTGFLARGGTPGPMTIIIQLGGHEVGRAIYDMTRDGLATIHPRSVRAEAPI